MNLLKKFKSLKAEHKAFALSVLTIFMLCTIAGIYFCYYRNYVYEYFGKSSWSHQKDKEAGKYVVEKYFLEEKLPDNYSDLKYNINGYCGFDCDVHISVKVDKPYFENLVADKKPINASLKSSKQVIMDSSYWNSIDNEIVSKPKNLDDIYISNAYYPSYYWYQDGRLFYHLFKM